MSVRVYPFDISKGLDSPEAIAIFMADIMESGDPSVIAGGIGEVAKASGMTTLSRMTGISREHLYKSFSETGNPTLKSLNAVLQALGVQLSAKPIKKRRITKHCGSTPPSDSTCFVS